MGKRRIIVVATPFEETRQAIHSLFSDIHVWNILDAATGAQALQVVQEYNERISLFVLDIALCDADGQAAAAYVQTPPTVDCPPVVLLMPAAEHMQGRIPDEMFISDVIETPIERRVAARRLQVIMELHEYQKKDVSFQHTISRDPLIGLLNGKALPLAIDKAMAASKDASGLLAYINIDNTRAMNERSGYHFGDLVLVETAKTIVDKLPENAVIGRLFGDTFVAFVPGRLEQMENICLLEDLKRSLRRTYEDAPGGPQTVTVCIGAASSPEDGLSARALIDAAGTANNAAKQMGRDVLLFYAGNLRHKHTRHGHKPDIEEKDQIPTPVSETFMPVINAESGECICYDYVSLRIEDDTYAVQKAIERIARLPEASSTHFLRMDVKQFFLTLSDLVNWGVELPRVSFYTVLRGGQAEVLPQVLQQMLMEHPVDPGKICIHIAQEMVLEMSRGHLENLARDVRALGFSFGVHNVGDTSIVNACYNDRLFDRVMFTPGTIDDVVNGVYPQAFVERVLGYFVHMGIELCFPVALSKASRQALVQSMGGTFGSYDDIIRTTKELVAHMQTHAGVSAPLPQACRKAPVLRIGEDRFNEIFLHSGIILFDWQPHTNVVSFSQSFDDTYSGVDQGKRPEELLGDILHPQDADRLRDMLLQVKHGRPNAEGIFRVRRSMGGEESYKWRRFFLISSKQSDDVVSHVFCISIDVDREQREMQDFKKRAETDPLTGLLNRGATEDHIRTFLEQEGVQGEHALMIIDIDDFKKINDTMGHIAGDEALQSFARRLQTLFRRDDIIGRIGGDEYMVFVKNIGDETMVHLKASGICKPPQTAKGDDEWNLACTVGVARYPKDGKSFETLYAKADLALYRAKEAGKKSYQLYEEEAGETGN